jgi:type I restriction enzyme S subunit
MSEIKGYPLQRLGDLVFGNRGVSYKPEDLKAAVNHDSVVLLRSNNIHSGALNFENIQIVPRSLVSESQKLKKGDIAVCMSNGSRQLVGKSGMLQNEPEYPLTVGAFCSVFRCMSEDDSDYVRYLFQSRAYQHGIDITLAGSAINNLKNSDIEEIEVPVAPKRLRKKISEVLKTIDNQIDATQALIDKYTAIKQGMMADLFSRGIDPETKALRPTFEEAPELYHKTPLGMLPKEWLLVRTETVAREVVVGIVIEPSKYYTSEGVPVFRSANIQENNINPRNFVYMSEESNQINRKSMLRTGDVITVRTGYPGTTCVVTEEYERSNAVDIIITRLGESVTPQFFSLWVNSDSGKRQVLSTQGGLAQQHFNVGEMKNLLLPKISLKEQELILQAANCLLSKIKLETQYLLKLKQQKSGLMQDLLAGKVPVPV